MSDEPKVYQTTYVKLSEVLDLVYPIRPSDLVAKYHRGTLVNLVYLEIQYNLKLDIDATFLLVD